MKRKYKLGALLGGLIIAFSCILSACGGKETGSLARSVKFPDFVQETGDYVNLKNFANQSTTNNSTVDGVVVCPYYNVTFTGGKVYSYSVPMYQGEIHSFGYIEATPDMFPLEVTVTVDYPDEELQSAVVIPEKFGIEAKVEGNKVKFTIESFDYYTVLFNGKFNFERPYTLIVREYKEVEIPRGYKVIEYEAGLHFVDNIPMESNTFVYLHSGAYLVCKQPSEFNEKWVTDAHGQAAWNAFMYSTGTENLRVGGYGVIDMSNLTWHARSPINFTTCNNITIEGITIINSPSWSIFLTDCKNIVIRDVVMMAYRTNSDGTVLCNCKDALVENCFIRSGDDLFEVKATRASADNSGTGGENITYRHCQAWADKSRCFGFIQESLMDVNNVLYEDCSALFQNALWNDAMGSFLVVVGDSSTVSNVKFKDCDSYYCTGNVINICAETNEWTFDQEGGCTGGLHDISVENFKYYSYYYDEQGAEKKNNGARLVCGEDLTEDNFYNISFQNMIRDGVKVESWAGMEYIQKGAYRNITLDGQEFLG